MLGVPIFTEMSEPEDLEVSAEVASRCDRLRLAINKANGVAKVSKMTRIPQTTLGNYLGGRDMKVSVLVAIARACKVSLEWLATGDGQMDETPPTSGFMPGFASVIHEPLNFWAAFVLLRSCQEYHGHIGLKPTIAETLEWMGPPYLKARNLPDLKIEFQAPTQE